MKMRKSIQFLYSLILCVFTTGKAQTSYEKDMITKYLHSCIIITEYSPTSINVLHYKHYFSDRGYDKVDHSELIYYIKKAITDKDIREGFFISHLRPFICDKQSLYSFLKGTKDYTNADYNTGDLTDYIIKTYGFYCEEKERKKQEEENQKYQQQVAKEQEKQKLLMQRKNIIFDYKEKNPTDYQKIEYTIINTLKQFNYPNNNKFTLECKFSIDTNNIAKNDFVFEGNIDAVKKDSIKQLLNRIKLNPVEISGIKFNTAASYKKMSIESNTNEYKFKYKKGSLKFKNDTPPENVIETIKQDLSKNARIKTGIYTYSYSVKTVDTNTYISANKIKYKKTIGRKIGNIALIIVAIPVAILIL